MYDIFNRKVKVMDKEQILNELVEQTFYCSVSELEGKIKEYILRMKDVSSKEDLLGGTLQKALQEVLFALEDKLSIRYKIKMYAKKTIELLTNPNSSPKN